VTPDFRLRPVEEADFEPLLTLSILSPGHFRISYATSDDVLKEACTRIKKFCAGMK